MDKRKYDVPRAGDQRDDGPMHYWFSLSYSSFLVVPRTIIQSMPVEWQERLLALINEANEATRGTEYEDNRSYSVQAREDGMFVEMLPHYRRAPVLALNKERGGYIPTHPEETQTNG